MPDPAVHGRCSRHETPLWAGGHCPVCAYERTQRADTAPVGPGLPEMNPADVDWVRLAEEFGDIRRCVRAVHGGRYDRALRFAFASAYRRQVPLLPARGEPLPAGGRPDPDPPTMNGEPAW